MIANVYITQIQRPHKIIMRNYFRPNSEKMAIKLGQFYYVLPNANHYYMIILNNTVSEIAGGGLAFYLLTCGIVWSIWPALWPAIGTKIGKSNGNGTRMERK